MDAPKFVDGKLSIEDYTGTEIELSERAWKHITDERSRRYFKEHYGKIVLTLQEPDKVFRSTKEKNVVIYERRFDDFFVANTVMGRAYIAVIVNWGTKCIRTAYPTRDKRNRGPMIWPEPKK